MRRVPRALEGQQAGIRKRPHEPVLLLTGHERVPLAVHEQHRLLDPAKARRKVHVEQPRERGPPDPRGELQALGHEGVEAARWQRPLGRRGLELAYELGVDRVLEAGHRVSYLHDHRISSGWARSAGEHELAHALRPLDGDLLRDIGAHRVPRHDRRVEPELVHQLERVRRVVLCLIAGFGPLGVSVSALGHGDRADGLRQVPEDRLPRAPGVGEPVKEEDRGSFSLFDVGQPHQCHTSMCFAWLPR